MTELLLPHGVVYAIDEAEKRVESRFPDGSVCLGVASFRTEDVERARALGYGGDDVTAAWHMHREHDLAHHLVAQALGWPFSQVLYLAARGATSFPAGVYATEERIAFLAARAANLGSVSALV